MQANIVGNTMSFASEVKKEIANVEANLCCYKAELYSIVRYRAQLKISKEGFKILIETMQNAIARRIVYLFRIVYDIKLQVQIVKQEGVTKKKKYIINVKDDDFAILRDLKILGENYDFINSSEEMFANECCRASVLRGAFLAKGSINDPNKSNYHLEILTDNIEGANLLVNLLRDVNIDAKVVERSKGFVVYLKKAEQIGDFLKFVGAVNNLFVFEDQRIKRDYSNYVNRLMNCDIANEEKAIATANRQLENINFIIEKVGIINLTPRLVDAVILRTTFPDYSLSQLSEESPEAIGHYVSKSGLSHCFKDIELMCEEIKKRNS